jgi:N-acetylmuramoyl-L-alanine amidase
MYPVSEQLIKYNRSGQKLVPEGFVIHDTATPGATAQNEHDYFNSGDRQTSAHYFVDWTQIVRTVPENEVAWHAGSTANHKYLSVEMCGPKTHDPMKFQEIWNRTVWLVADAFARYGWSTGPGLWSHSGISNKYHETDHQDPIAYFKEYGKTFDGFVAEVDAMILQLKNKPVMVGENKVFTNLVIYQDGADKRAAEYLADYFKAPIVCVDNITPELLTCAKNMYKVGGAAYPGAQLISGSDRFGTMAAVLKFAGR